MGAAMPMIDLRLNADGMMRDVAPDRLRHTVGPIRIGVLEGRMTSGAPSVVIAVDLGDGAWVAAETSLVLFLAAAEALRARFGAPRDGHL
jgi:hypothetical protein